MSAPPSRYAGELLSIGAAANGAHDVMTRAHDALELIQNIVPFAAASIAGWDPGSDRHYSIATRGYPQEVESYLNDDFIRNDELYQLMRQGASAPLRWADTPFNYRKQKSAKEVFIPAGFDEGFSACLYSSDHRYTGVLHLSVHQKNDIEDAAMTAANWLQTLLSPIADQMTFVSSLNSSINPDGEGILVRKDGGFTELSGVASGTDRAELNELASLAQTRWIDLRRRGMARWLWISSSGRWVSVQSLSVPQGLLIMHEPGSPPYSLTRREMEIIGAVIAGATNIQIGSLLGLSPRTVAKHLENILVKTGIPSRTGLASQALTEGFAPLA